MFKDQSLISWDDHSEWFSKVISDSNKYLMVGELDGEPFGIVRFDISENNFCECFVSINLSPKYRKKGLSKILLNTSIKKLRKFSPQIESVIAEVKINNIVSQSLFLSSEFMISSKNSDYIIYRNHLDKNI